MNKINPLPKAPRKKRTKRSKSLWNRQERHQREHEFATAGTALPGTADGKRRHKTDDFCRMKRPLETQASLNANRIHRGRTHRKHNGKAFRKVSESSISLENGRSFSTTAKTAPSRPSSNTDGTPVVFLNDNQQRFSLSNDVVDVQCNNMERNFTDHINKIHAFIRQQVKVELPHCDSLFDSLAGVMPRNASRNAFNFNPDRCRHPDVICLDQGRVMLNSAKDFIHANRVPISESGSEEIILTQLPLKSTVMDFWQMIWDENVRSIFVILTQAEWNHFGRKLRMIPDWRGCLHKPGGLCIAFQQEYVVSPVWSVTFYGLSWGGVHRCVQWIHYTDWAHGLAPSETNTIWQINSYLRRSKKPIVCMSMSGVGRAGTYAILEMAHERLHNRNNKRINLAEYLQKVRDTRIHALQTRAQFGFLQIALLDHILACDRVRIDVKADYLVKYKRIRSTKMAKTGVADDEYK